MLLFNFCFEAVKCSKLRIECEMMMQKQSKAKQVSIMAMIAALYAIFFYGILSKICYQDFTLLYLPVILLGVFPLWFGWSGLAGCYDWRFYWRRLRRGGTSLCCMGRNQLPPNYLHGLNWLLMPQERCRRKDKKKSCSAYALSTLSLFS